MDSLSRSRGFSLIEMMVALLLGMILTASVSSALIGGLRGYDNTRANQQLTGKSRTNMLSARYYLQQAGYRNFDQIILNTDFTQANVLGFDWVAGQFIRGMNDVAAYANALPGTDVVSWRTFGDLEGSLVGCDGLPLSNDSQHQSQLFVSSANELICQTETGVNVVLDENVLDMQVLYGQQGNGGLVYRAADQVADWLLIDRIKIALLIEQPLSLSEVPNQQLYQVLDREVAPAETPSLRTVVTETILLRNARG